ncbi:MAG TPA: ATP-dependent helicase [Acidimicrobiales bacterium]|nr:ATP-dependent helicase [Acidimicrobiales bacterium]
MFTSQRELNERQREAASFGDGPLRVIAGPGTGKTTTLTARVSFLLERGVAPERILLLTFTRRSAREIVSRVRALRGAELGRRVSGGTFHSVAHHTLRRHHAAVGLPDGFGVLDRGDAADLMDLVRGELGILSRERRLPKKATLGALYSRTVNTGMRLADVMGETTPWCVDSLDEVGSLFTAFVARKRSLGLLDFDDLLLFWRVAAQDDSLGEELGAAYDYILVDEFQDVNQLQLDVLVGLRRTDSRLTIVGDDAQAIYGFRGATARFLLDAERYFNGLTTITLDVNYRSSAAILGVANAVAADAPEGFSSVLREKVPIIGANQPLLVHCADERDQSESVADRVLELYEQGISLQKQAVLFRAAHHSADLEIELSRRRIPFVKYGGLRYLEAAHVKDMLAAFRLADNPRDEMAWFRLLQLMPGVGPSKARRAIDALRGVDAKLPLSHGEIQRRWSGVVDELPSDVEDLSCDLADALGGKELEPIEVHAERIRRAIVPLISSTYEDAAARLEDLGALVLACTGTLRLSDVAAEQALEPPASTGDLAGPPMIDEDWLVLSTVHSAKGLEFDAVHVIHAADGNFPSDMSLGSPEGLEEERRLFYVAVTRARRNLAVYVPLRYHHHRVRDDHSWAQPSRFLSEPVRSTLVEVPSTGKIQEVPSSPTTIVIDGSGVVEGQLSRLW